MSSFRKVIIHHFRNLGSVSIEPSSQLNFIVGANGSGKTSFLEALAVLAHGKSFRTHKFRRLIQDGQHRFVLFSEVQEQVGLDAAGRCYPLGVERDTQGKVVIKREGRRLHSASELAQSLPVMAIAHDSFRILEGGPLERRRFLDWLVFHVKHDFYQHWLEVGRCYKQRNTLLRRGKITHAELSTWDAEIAVRAVEIERARLEVFSLLVSAYREVVKALAEDCSGGQCDFLSELVLHYRSGWKYEGKEAGEALTVAYCRQSLSESLIVDQRRGHTSVGPHKADILLRRQTTGENAVDVLSRGQQKTVFSALMMARAAVHKAVKGFNPVVLVDDLTAELDIDNQHRFGLWLSQLGSQVFISSIDSSLTGQAWVQAAANVKVFHVKHGEFKLETKG